MKSRGRRVNRLPMTAALIVGASGFAACGGDSNESSPSTDDTPTEIPFADGDAGRGEELTTANGCQACHQVDQDRVGPMWGGLAGSMVTLDDGTSVLADRAYLALAITDPGAQKVDGFQVAMPENRLTSSEVADVVAYLESLGTPAAAETSAP